KLHRCQRREQFGNGPSAIDCIWPRRNPPFFIGEAKPAGENNLLIVNQRDSRSANSALAHFSFGSRGKLADCLIVISGSGGERALREQSDHQNQQPMPPWMNAKAE